VREDVEYYTGRSRAIPAAVQVPIALQYLARNARQIEISRTFKLLQRSIFECVHRVCSSLTDKIGQFIYFPDDHREINRIKRSFYQK